MKKLNLYETCKLYGDDDLIFLLLVRDGQLYFYDEKDILKIKRFKK